jgi:hypothetical protein
MFELALTEMTHCQIRAEVRAKGLKYSRNRISAAFRNPIYIGKLVIQPNENELVAWKIQSLQISKFILFPTGFVLDPFSP